MTSPPLPRVMSPSTCMMATSPTTRSSICIRPPEWAASRRPLRACQPPISKNQRSDVVGLRRALRELFNHREQMLEHDIRLAAVTPLHRLHQAIATELLVCQIPRFGHAVTAHHNEIARL